MSKQDHHLLPTVREPESRKMSVETQAVWLQSRALTPQASGSSIFEFPWQHPQRQPIMFLSNPYG